jgi:serine protease AprX
MRVPKTQDASFALEMAGELDVSTFQLDPDYQPIPSTPTREHEAQMNAAEEQAVFVRGEIEEGRIPELEAQANVVGVWLDTPIEPFEIEVEEQEAPSLRQLDLAVGTCPISPCDCNSNVAKGTINDVAQYLGANQIWARGRRGQGIVVGVVDGGITAEGRPVKAGQTSRRIPRVIGGWPTADWGTEASAWGEHGNMCSTRHPPEVH